MKTITAKEAREILKGVWPGLKHIWIFDQRLALPTLEQVKQGLNDSRIFLGRFFYELFDCDDYALNTHAAVKGWVASQQNKIVAHNWAFGEVAMEHPDLGIHNQNIFISHDKVWLYEPQDRQFIEPGKGEKPFYVRM